MNQVGERQEMEDRTGFTVIERTHLTVEPGRKSDWISDCSVARLEREKLFPKNRTKNLETPSSPRFQE
ncbi:hypothetical protein T265_05874 [Opisthorchis viverrini]|uniref:Uncharacterized protein n=1 Tax=Opisthorchis viverrini TaxID=6198 RepID=A0A074ZMH5_OPIVI|nr:hypothetical protein T265_05874 [Opisthorchis viverrini]KER26967.1 hypothetical protein T265_05874 [Opisthorchis viverrini]